MSGERATFRTELTKDEPDLAAPGWSRRPRGVYLIAVLAALWFLWPARSWFAPSWSWLT